jgi:hypothetical protein
MASTTPMAMRYRFIAEETPSFGCLSAWRGRLPDVRRWLEYADRI